MKSAYEKKIVGAIYRFPVSGNRVKCLAAYNDGAAYMLTIDGPTKGLKFCINGQTIVDFVCHSKHKSPMKYLLRAWKKETKSLGWDKSFQTKKKWKDFCRGNALISIENLDDEILNQDDADYIVCEELTYWND